MKNFDLLPILEKTLENPKWIREKEKIEDFLRYDLDDEYCHLGEVKEAIDEVKIVKNFGKCSYIDKIICFMYSNIINFRGTDKVEGVPISEKFIDNVKGPLCNEIHIHHSPVTGNNIGCSHSYCNFKVRENKEKISVVEYNLFHFDFFLKV